MYRIPSYHRLLLHEVSLWLWAINIQYTHMTSFRFTDVFPRSSESLKRKEGSLENTLSLVSCQPSGFSSIHTTTTCQCHARTHICTPLVTSIDLENRGRTNISAGVCSAFLSVVVCVFSINGNGCLALPYPDPEFPLLQISFFKKPLCKNVIPYRHRSFFLPTHAPTWGWTESFRQTRSILFAV